MTTYKTASKQLLSNYACISTLEPTEIVIGQSVTVGSLGAPFNGTFTVLALPQYLYVGVDGDTGEFLYNTAGAIPNQILFACTGDDVEFVKIFTGTVAYTQTCTWITAAQILTWLGIATATADDTTFVTQCASAANAFCYRRRQEVGYFDSLTTSPSGDVTLGTIMYGGALYRQRGGISDFASFNGMQQGSTNGLSPLVKQLLGVDRPQVA
jgi:outer membrane protein assembly factor BamB